MSLYSLDFHNQLVGRQSSFSLQEYVLMYSLRQSDGFALHVVHSYAPIQDSLKIFNEMIGGVLSRILELQFVWDER